MMGRPRQVIVNADDFGISPGVNRGIIEAHVRGIVTSTSVMVRGPEAGAAAILVRDYPALGIGLHVDLGEWVQRDGGWVQVDEVVDVSDGAAVAAEIERQLAGFMEIVGRAPDHLDSHQHVHLEEPARSALMRVGARLDVGVRRLHPEVGYQSLYGQDRHGASYPEWVSAEAYVAALATLRGEWTEFCCHPGYVEGLSSGYLVERELELVALCDDAVQRAVTRNGVVLTSWRDVGFGARRGDAAAEVGGRP